MIPIERITEQELGRRFNALPGVLKEALDSATNVRIVNQTCGNHRLIDEEKQLTIQQLVAFVLFGFIHSYDVAGEINEALELDNPKLAASIADELNAKIFAPLKADLEANYHPLPEIPAAAPLRPATIAAGTTPPTSPQAPQPVGTGPKIIEEVKKPEFVKDEKEAEGGIMTPVQEAPKPGAQPKITEEGEKRKEEREIPKPAGPPQPTQPVKLAPFMLHAETEVRPVTRAPAMKLDLTPPPVRRPQAQPSPPIKPAELELGTLPAATKPEGPVRIAPQAPRVVHYTEFKTPFGKPAEGQGVVSRPAAPPPPASLPTSPVQKISAALPASGASVPPPRIAARPEPVQEPPRIQPKTGPEVKSTVQPPSGLELPQEKPAPAKAPWAPSKLSIPAEERPQKEMGKTTGVTPPEAPKPEEKKPVPIPPVSAAPKPPAPPPPQKPPAQALPPSPTPEKGSGNVIDLSKL